MQLTRGVLVLEDDSDTAELTVMLLAAEGYRVQAVTTVADALEAVRREVPACVLLDYQMNGPDGLDFARAIRRDYADSITLIAVSGWKPTDPRVAELARLVDHFFVKPFDWDTCFAVLPRR